MGLLDNLLNSFGMGLDDYDDDDDYAYEEETSKKSGGFFSKKKSEPEYEEPVDNFDRPYTSRNTETYADSGARVFKNRPSQAPTQMQTFTTSSRSAYQNVPKSSSKLVPLTSNPGNNIYSIKPVDDTECWAIIDYLKDNKAVILNLDGMNVNDAQHIIDIIVGCCYTIEGNIKQISSFIFVAAPASVDISGDFYEQALSRGDGVVIDLDNQLQ